MKITLKPVRIETGSPDEDGRLVFADDRLVAILVRLSDQHEAAGKWFLEAAFGPAETGDHPVFADLDAASTWLAARFDPAIR
ncbi:hypothetical protein ACUN0C_10535 [Faunimonas sp. B44]|uniref:hypothetical protein n=1 Tax=Faunimonas sp. B44 TaxID=3461493 RepID=UPI00404463F3